MLMSIGVQRAKSFLDPLRGKLSVFVVKDRPSGLLLGRLLTSCASSLNSPYAVLDLDAFYASNFDFMKDSDLPAGHNAARFQIPEVGSKVSEALLGFLRQGESKVLILDNLNSFFHLLSAEHPTSAARKLTFATAVMSQIARTNGVAFLCTIYERDGPIRRNRPRSFSENGDATVSVKVDEGRLVLRCRRGTLWPSGSFGYP